MLDIQATYKDPHIHTPVGTILMGHKGDIVVPIAFAISGVCPPLSAGYTELNKNVGLRLMGSHGDCFSIVASCLEFRESATMFVDGVEYRAMLDLKMENELYLDFPILVGLLVGTVQALSGATGGDAFEMVILTGKVNGSRFDASWTWYNSKNEITGGC